MFEKFYPDERVESAYVIPYEKLYEEGYRGLIFDIDNTLVPHGKPADKRAVELFERIEGLGFKCCLLSNNNSRRVEPFARKVGCEYLSMAMKPKRSGYYRAMKKLGTNLGNTIFIGDQLFTDVWGARRIGMRNILVKPINHNEKLQIIMKRGLERMVLKRWEREQGED